MFTACTGRGTSGSVTSSARDSSRSRLGRQERDPRRRVPRVHEPRVRDPENVCDSGVLVTGKRRIAKRTPRGPPRVRLQPQPRCGFEVQPGCHADLPEQHAPDVAVDLRLIAQAHVRATPTGQRDQPASFVLLGQLVGTLRPRKSSGRGRAHSKASDRRFQYAAISPTRKESAITEPENESRTTARCRPES